MTGLNEDTFDWVSVLMPNHLLKIDNINQMKALRVKTSRYFHCSHIQP